MAKRQSRNNKYDLKKYQLSEVNPEGVTSVYWNFLLQIIY